MFDLVTYLEQVWLHQYSNNLCVAFIDCGKTIVNPMDVGLLFQVQYIFSPRLIIRSKYVSFAVPNDLEGMVRKDQEHINLIW